MVKIVIVAKTGQCKNLDVKKFDKEDLYKKCKLRKKNDFKKEHTWQIESNLYVSLFAKDSGKAGSENKYELPPPVDSNLYFGEMAIVLHTEEDLENDKVVDLKLDNWGEMYTSMMGGFEDLDSDDEDSEEEYISPEHLTEEGYSKEDGFIVDNDVVEDEEYDPEDENSESSDCATSDTSDEDSELSEEEYE